MSRSFIKALVAWGKYGLDIKFDLETIKKLQKTFNDAKVIKNINVQIFFIIRKKYKKAPSEDILVSPNGREILLYFDAVGVESRNRLVSKLIYKKIMSWNFSITFSFYFSNPF